MSIFALVLLPVILLYQSWSYHVFRARLGNAEPAANPVDLLAREARPGDRRLTAAATGRRLAACEPLDPRLLRRARAARVALGADAALGVAAALLVLAQAVLLARVAARAFAGATLAEVALAARAARRSWSPRAPRRHGASRPSAYAAASACSRSCASTSSRRG